MGSEEQPHFILMSSEHLTKEAWAEVDDVSLAKRSRREGRLSTGFQAAPFSLNKNFGELEM